MELTEKSGLLHLLGVGDSVTGELLAQTQRSAALNIPPKWKVVRWREAYAQYCNSENLCAIEQVKIFGIDGYIPNSIPAAPVRYFFVCSEQLPLVKPASPNSQSASEPTNQSSASTTIPAHQSSMPTATTESQTPLSMAEIMKRLTVTYLKHKQQSNKKQEIRRSSISLSDMWVQTYII